MSEIHESRDILCPFEDVPRAAEHFLTTLPLENGKRVIELHVTIGDLSVARKADLELTPRSAFPTLKIMEIGWQPHDGGPYPTFHGTLSVEEIDGLFSRLDLDGTYEPPLGLAGLAFDAVLGHRLAVAAVRQLLSDLKLGFELAYQTGMTVPAN
ncbi:MAG: hypothetical protein ABSH03_03390 [Candidatus Lustribacter sp.]